MPQDSKSIEIFYPNKKYPLIIDIDDYDIYKQYRWNIPNGKYPYAVYNKKYTENSSIYLHRLLLNAPNDMVVDHINRNTLDNRRCNLRLCRLSENGRNRKFRTFAGKTSKYNGVFLRKDCDEGKRRKLWRACIRFNGRLKNIGSFKTEEEAARAYDIKALELFGEFANLNFTKESVGGLSEI